MSLNTMKFDNKDIYVIEVANGQIAIDMGDTSFIERIEKLQSDYEKSLKRYENAVKVIEKKNDLTVTKNKISARDRALLKEMNRFINEQGQALNTLFGKNAVDKIFYDELWGETRVTVRRLDILFNELLPPHLERAQAHTKKDLEKFINSEELEEYLEDEETIKVVD